MFQSSIPYTIEAPLNPRGGNLTPAERRRRSGINTDVHEVAIKTTLKYIQDHRNQVLFDHAEVFRRGNAGEQPRVIPDGFVPGWGPEDNYTTTFPRSYVIPAGARQHSAPAAKRLVDLLIAQRRSRVAGQGGLHRRRPVLPGRLLRDRHAPAQARHRELAARAGPGHHRPRRRPVRRPGRLEPRPHVGRDRRHARDREPHRREGARLRRRGPGRRCPRATPTCSSTRRTDRTSSRSTRCWTRASRSRA